MCAGGRRGGRDVNLFEVRSSRLFVQVQVHGRVGTSGARGQTRDFRTSSNPGCGLS